MIQEIRNKLNLDQTDEGKRTKYIKDFSWIVKELFPEGNDCDLCFGRGYISFNVTTKQMVVCDCVNEAVIKHKMKDSRN